MHVQFRSIISCPLHHRSGWSESLQKTQPFVSWFLPSGFIKHGDMEFPFQQFPSVRGRLCEHCTVQLLQSKPSKPEGDALWTSHWPAFAFGQPIGNGLKMSEEVREATFSFFQFDHVKSSLLRLRFVEYCPAGEGLELLLVVYKPLPILDWMIWKVLKLQNILNI